MRSTTDKTGRYFVKIAIQEGDAPRRIYRTADIQGAREWRPPWWVRLGLRLVAMFRRTPKGEYAYTVTDVYGHGGADTDIGAVVKWHRDEREDRDGNG